MIYLLTKYNCIAVSNIHLVEMILLVCAFVLFSLLNQIIIKHIHSKNTSSNIGIYYISIEIIVKCIWILFTMNEFCFIFCGSAVNILIVIGYNYQCPSVLVVLMILFISHVIHAYVATKVNKEWYISRKLRFSFVENDIAFIDVGYLQVHMNNDFNMHIANKNEYISSIFKDAEHEDIMQLLNEMNEINPQIKEKLLHIAKDKAKVREQLENLTNMIKENDNDMFYNSNKVILTKEQNESNIDASTIRFAKLTSNNNILHDGSSFVGDEPQLVHRESKSQTLNVVNNPSMLLNNMNYQQQQQTTSCSRDKMNSKDNLQQTTLSVNINKIAKKPSYNRNEFPLKAQTIIPKAKTVLPLKKISNFSITNKHADACININNTQCNGNNMNNNTNMIKEANLTAYEDDLLDNTTLLPILVEYTKSQPLPNNFDFIYLGKRKINLKEYSIDTTHNKIQSTSRTVFRSAVDNSPTYYTYYKVYFRLNFILNSLEFIFVDESKFQYENIFKMYSRQTSMYLHDFKNPLIAINEKIIEYRDALESLLLDCDDRDNPIANFQYGRDEIDDFNFLSVTSNDCLGMIKSYEDFARAFSEGTDVMRLNLSLFSLNDVTKYLTDWMNNKLAHSHTHNNLQFNIHTLSLPDNYYLYTDQLKLKRILINIISNSFKFTNDGSITLFITKEKIDNVSYMKFLIKDTGTGMDKETMKNLFNPYFSNNNDKRNKEGCGLGLILAMRMSKSIGLGIEVHSEVNKGTEMWFYCEEREKPLSITESSQMMHSLNNKKDDDNNVLTQSFDNNNNNNNKNNNGGVGSMNQSLLSSNLNKSSQRNQTKTTNNNTISNNNIHNHSINTSRCNPIKRNKTIKHSIRSCKTKSFVSKSRSSMYNPVIAPEQTVSTQLDANGHKNSLLISSHSLIDEDFYSVKRAFENSKLGSFASHFNKNKTKTTQKYKSPIPIKRSLSICDTTINDDYVMIINPNDKPVIPHHNQALRDISKSNTRSHSLIYTNGLNLVGLRRKSRRSLSPSPHQITINNNVNTRNSLILTNPNEDSSFSGLSMVKQEVAVSIEGKNYDHNVLSPTFHGNASGMNCNRIFSAYNYHKTKSHITSFAGSRNLIAKNESKPTVSYTTGSSNDNGASGLKKNHSFKKNLAVLVVDDDENFQKSYKRVIENLGVDDVTCINDGLDLLMMFLKSELNNYDVIIMDNFMTYVDGTEAVRIIKYMKDMGVGKKKIFDYTILQKIHIATSAQDLAMSCLEQMDCIEFVEKPISKEAMIKILKKCSVKQ